MSFLNVDDTLDSFRTSFWLEEKRWFVAQVQEDRSVFSIPYFAPDEIEIPERLRICSTAPNGTFLYDNVDKITIKAAEIQHHHYFTLIETLELECSILLETLDSVMDLHQIKYLIIPSLNDLLIFMPLKDKIPRLNELTIKNTLTIDMIERIRSYRFEQIRKLELSISGVHSDYIIEELFRLFPSIYHLEVKDYVESERTMIRLIDGFKHLSNASFHVRSSSNDCDSSLYQNRNLIIQHSRRLIPDNFTCRIYHSSDNHLLYNWWIDNHVSQFHILKSSLVFLLYLVIDIFSQKVLATTKTRISLVSI
jgi:hypothetical protein